MRYELDRKTTKEHCCKRCSFVAFASNNEKIEILISKMFHIIQAKKYRKDGQE